MTHENKSPETLVTQKPTSSFGNASGIIDFAGNILSAAFNQWQQLVMFLSPYIDTIRSFPKKIYSETGSPCAEYVYNGLYNKFADYTLTKFVADIVNIVLTLILLPLTVTVAILRGIRDKSANVCTSVCSCWGCLQETYEWTISTSKPVINWFQTTRDELRNGDLTWKDLWNDALDCLVSGLQRSVTYFGEESKFTWVVNISKINKLLEVLHFDVKEVDKE